MVAINPVTASATHFENLLSMGKISVPSLQRAFSWENKQVTDFIKDLLKVVARIEESPASQAEHLFGTIVLINSQNFGEASKIVDGQQRITIVTLTLGLLEQEMNRLILDVEHRGGPQAAAIVGTLKGYITEIHSKLWIQELLQEEVLRFQPSPEIFHSYTSLLSGGNGHYPSEIREPAKNLRRVSEIIKNELISHSDMYEGREPVEKIRHLDRVKDVLLKRLLVVCVSTSSVDSGYALFEVLNARGKELEPLDLIKTWIMSQMAFHPLENDISEKFRNLSNDDKDSQHDYLSDYFKAKTRQDLGSKDLVANAESVRKFIFRDPDLNDLNHKKVGIELQNEIVKQVDLMTSWEKNWIKICDGIWPYEQPNLFGQHRLNMLVKVLGHTLPIPLLLQASVKLSANDFLSVVHVLEKVFFRYKVICRKPPQKLNELYNRFIQTLDLNDQMQIDVFKNEAQLLLDGEASDDLFSVNLKEQMQYGVAARNKKIKYFLWTLDIYLSNPQPSVMTYDLDELWIEHVSPQTPREGSSSLPQELCDHLGNLCLLTPEENIELSNHSFAWKKNKVEEWKVLNPPHLLNRNLSRNVFDLSDWDSASFDAREQYLLNLACTVFRADSGVI
jgi:uncharacterized protein with ParB-like and HNH nuclease domain